MELVPGKSQERACFFSALHLMMIQDVSRRGPSSEPNHASVLISDFQPLELGDIMCYCL